jgi:hypothetical protein
MVGPTSSGKVFLSTPYSVQSTVQSFTMRAGYYMIGDKNLVANPRVVTSNDERFLLRTHRQESLSFSRVQSDSWHHRQCIFMLAVTISASFLSFFFSFSFGSWVGVELYKSFFFIRIQFQLENRIAPSLKH